MKRFIVRSGDYKGQPSGLWHVVDLLEKSPCKIVRTFSCPDVAANLAARWNAKEGARHTCGGLAFDWACPACVEGVPHPE